MVVVAFALAALPPSMRAGTLPVCHQQRYAMGTMFDIVVYHPSRPKAERAVRDAFAEILRLERILSHYQTDSELSKLNREARFRPVSVDPSLADIIRRSIAFSHQTGGTFDITIAPLLKAWRAAAADGRQPSPGELARARECVGFQHIDLSLDAGIRFRSECLELDLGGIGKGYAVDRALAVLKAAGIRHASVNAGGSSIAATGAPPGRRGWPVLLGGGGSGEVVLLLRDESVSTSEQDPDRPVGEIIDPALGVPAGTGAAVSVVAPSATTADALSTTALMLPVERAKALLTKFKDVSAVWLTTGGGVRAAFRERRLLLSHID